MLGNSLLAKSHLPFRAEIRGPEISAWMTPRLGEGHSRAV